VSLGGGAGLHKRMAKKPFWQQSQPFPFRGRYTLPFLEEDRNAVASRRSIACAKRDEESYHRIQAIIESEAVEEAANV
jgi:hypothetical protein